MMSGGKHLLLLAVFLLLERCQQKPQVLMSPKLDQVYSGDLVYLKCNDDTSGSSVKWYFNGTETPMRDLDYRIAVAKPSHSGLYQCEISNDMSEPHNIQVLDFEPSASLTIRTGQPVMQTGASVILSLHHEDGLQGWTCYVQRGDEFKTIKLRNTTEKSLDFQPRSLKVPETTFWCYHSGKSLRSNQITVRTSDKPVSLEMYPLLPVAGESLTLRCLTWGTNLIRRVVFYKDNRSLSDGSKDMYEIPSVTERDAGSYKCHASFTYVKNPAGLPYEEDSDAQDLLVQEPPMQAVLTEDMYCSCERCQSDTHSHWYRKSDLSWVYMGSTSRYLTTDRSGTYACKRVWRNGKSSMSNAVKYEFQEPGISITVLLLILLLLIAVVAVVGILIWRKRRSATGAIYEDVALRSRDKLGEKGDPAYDTLDPEAPRKRGEKEGEYEPLKREEMKEGEYQTLGVEQAAGGEGGYQALKKGDGKEGVYHTLGGEGAGGGEGGYEALKKGGEKEGVYHTLGTEGAAGGHEAVGKDEKDKDYEIVDEKK